jgi:hypothetical protein
LAHLSYSVRTVAVSPLLSSCSPCGPLPDERLAPYSVTARGANDPEPPLPIHPIIASDHVLQFD